MIFIIVLLGVFLGDLLLKKYVEARLPEGEEKTDSGRTDSDPEAA